MYRRVGSIGDFGQKWGKVFGRLSTRSIVKRDFSSPEPVEIEIAAVGPVDRQAGRQVQQQ